MLASNSGDQDPKKLEWRYRVKDRVHIPDFFEAMPDNVTVQSDKCLRFSTPLPKNSEGDEHQIEISFLKDLIKDPSIAAHMSLEEKEALVSQHLNKAVSDASLNEDLLFNEDSDDSFTLDYEIPKETLRKERICQRDKALFEKEKARREKDRLYKLERAKIEAEEKRVA